jgi:hypothetical protein
MSIPWVTAAFDAVPGERVKTAGPDQTSKVAVQLADCTMESGIARRERYPAGRCCVRIKR